MNAVMFFFIFTWSTPYGPQRAGAWERRPRGASRASPPARPKGRRTTEGASQPEHEPQEGPPEAVALDLREVLGPPLDVGRLLDAVPELSLSRGIEQSPYHHLDTFEHTLEVVRGVERELEEARLGARVAQHRVEGSASPPRSTTSPSP